jgi:hypothetical protein
MWRLFLNFLLDRSESPPEQIVTLRLTPARARFGLLAAVGGFLILLIVVYGLVQWFLPQTFLELKERSRETRRELKHLRQEHETLQQELVNIRMGGDVDRQSVELLRQQMRDQQQEMVDLRDQNELYKGMITPAELERGLLIRGWQMFSTADAQRFNFRLTIQQLTNKPVLLDGVVNITLLGTKNGTPAKLQMKELLGKKAAEALKFRFKFYQNLEGSFVLPEGFEPKEWIISAGSRKPRQETNKNFVWQIETPVVASGEELSVDNPVGLPTAAPSAETNSPVDVAPDTR